MWFDTTTAEAWGDRDDCKCFYPVNNVSIQLKLLNMSLFKVIFMWWVSVTMFIIPTFLIILIWVVMAHHFATESEAR